MNRREALTTVITGIGSTAMITPAPAPSPSFTYCLNMSTIRGQKLGFRKELEVAAQAGFRSVEIWINTFQDWLKAGNSFADTRRLLGDLGITPENAIGFAPWIIDDTEKRRKGLDQLKAEMEQLREIGCLRIAAPPMGATEGDPLDLRVAAERYRAILETGAATGVVPHLELWGFSKNLSRLSEVLYVATEAGHPDARLLLDVYHLYKGGSGHAQLGYVGKPLVEIFHVNDYPASPSREMMKDADRVYTGDGIAPLKEVLRTIRNPEKPVIISLELFNATYYGQPAQEVAQTGLQKMKALAEAL